MTQAPKGNDRVGGIVLHSIIGHYCQGRPRNKSKGGLTIEYWAGSGELS